MNFVIETVADAASEAAATRVREEVFGQDLQLVLPNLRAYDAGQILTLIARTADTNEPAAALSVVETTGNHGLHRRFGLFFGENARVARYAQLAVRKPYRGQNIPARMILEARRRFVVPRQFTQTWLLFNAETARTSALCTLLGFKAGSQTIQTEYGCSRVLFRDEASPAAQQWDRKATDYLNGVTKAGKPAQPAFSPLWVSPPRLLENEWLAH
jgi:hypothetical protein